MKRHTLLNNEIYHLYNRGVDKRDIYTDESEYRYFIHLLFKLNDTKAANNTHRNFKVETHGRGSTSTMMYANTREKLVEILAFALMPNHFHLLIKQKVDNGISKFMQKLGTGYTMLFNKKHDRSGVLFQGRYKSVPIETHHQLLYIPHYIHLNPLDLMDGNTNINSKCNFLEKYRWSSYRDYIGIRNFPSITDRSAIINMFGGTNRYKKDMMGFIKENNQINKLDEHTRIDNPEK